jgi:hypothetical protein
MAYGLKFQLTFNDEFQASTGTRNVYKIFLYKDGYTGSVYDLIGDASPFVIETISSEGNSYSPIIATRASLNVLSSTGFDITEFLNASDSDFFIDVKGGTYDGTTVNLTKTVWQGFFVPVERIEFGVVEPNYYSLTFVDGLSKLKEKRYYYNGNQSIGYFAGEASSIKDIIIECLSKTDNTLNVWINEYYKTASVPSRNIENIFLRDNSFCKQPGEYYTYYEILEGICIAFGWECYFDAGVWKLQSYAALRMANLSYYVYNVSGAYLSTQTLAFEPSVIIDSTNNFKQVGKSLIISVNKAKYSMFNQAPVNGVRGLPNNKFTSWASATILDGFENTGLTISESVSPTGVRITSVTTTPGTTSEYLKNRYTYAVKAGDNISVKWLETLTANTEAQYNITLTDGTTSYYLQNDGTFGTSYYILPKWDDVAATWPKYTNVPIDGNIELYIFKPYYSGTGGTPSQVVQNFLIDQYGISSNIFNFDAVNYISSLNNKFGSNRTPNIQTGFFINVDLEFAIDGSVLYTDIEQVATDYYLGAFTGPNNVYIENEFGRGAPGTIKLFTLVGQDVGVDELQTQYTIEGDFMSAGYWINKKFVYNYTINGGIWYDYILKEFKWDLKMAMQQAKLCKVNFSGTYLNVSVTEKLNTKQ